MHREKTLDFWLTVATVISLFVPIWGMLLSPSKLISVPLYLLTAGSVALLVVVGTLVYARLRNRVMLNRFLVGYAGGLVGTGIVHLFLAIGVAMGSAPDFIYILGNLALGNGLVETPSTQAAVIGAVYHYLLNGAAWGAVYGLLIGKARWWVGAFFGMGIWAVLMVSPVFTQLGFKGVTPLGGGLVVLLLLVAHLLYGSAIGYAVYRFAFPEVGMEGSKAVRPAYS